MAFIQNLRGNTEAAQDVIANTMAGGTLQQSPSGEVFMNVGGVTLQVNGQDLRVEDGKLAAGRVTGLVLSEWLFSLQASVPIAPTIYDPTIITVSDLSWGFRGFNALVDAGAARISRAIEARDTSYTDSFGDNFAQGGNGDDTFEAVFGSDTYDGEAGFDTVTYESAWTSAFVPVFPLGAALAPIVQPQEDNPIGVIASLIDGTATRAEAPINTPAATDWKDTLIDIEHLTGTNADDVLRGSSVANTLKGLKGDDLVSGQGGNDTVDGGAGDDRVYGGAGNDVIKAGDGDDTLAGGEGEDRFEFDLGEEGRKVIVDFDAAEDELFMALLGFDLRIHQSGNHTVIRHTDDSPPPWEYVFGPDGPPPLATPAEPSSIEVILLNTQMDDLVMGENFDTVYALY